MRLAGVCGWSSAAHPLRAGCDLGRVRRRAPAEEGLLGAGRDRVVPDDQAAKQVHTYPVDGRSWMEPGRWWGDARPQHVEVAVPARLTSGLWFARCCSVVCLAPP